MSPANTFSKKERICGKAAVSALMKSGKWGMTAHYRYCWSTSTSEDGSRILVSVPKKYFKRAVKRNLLKRRTRESYRCNKLILEGKSLDIMFIYASSETAGFEELKGEVISILGRLAQ